MIENLPACITIIFILTTVLTLWFFFKATHSLPALIIAMVWIIIIGGIAFTGYYTITNTLPPRFVSVVGPPLLLIIFIFSTSKGRAFADQCDPVWLTWLHIVRIPVELTLFWLFLNKQVPEIMTFDGNNLDIISGLTAPLIALIGYRIQSSGKKIIVLIWNIACLILLFNIVVTAALAAPTPFQQLGFEQPNTGILYFPFIWLPGFIVPAVLFAHIICIRKWLAGKTL